jgi:hypothetical protein
MIAFWIAVVIGVVVGIVYVTLGVQAFIRVRRDVLAAASRGDLGAVPVEKADEVHEDAVFTWKALVAVVASTAVIALLGINSVFWYVPAILAVGSSVAVIAAFLIDRRAAA